MYTISNIAKQFSLSRSTLLYYDRIGILSPSDRGPNNYRLYTEADIQKLKQICLFRQIGIPLKRIATLLKAKQATNVSILKERLFELNQQISELRDQQNTIVNLLGQKELLKNTRTMTKEKWVSLLSKAGLDEEGMYKWHEEFEKQAPEAHQDFLESIGLDTKEIKTIRSKSSTTD